MRHDGYGGQADDPFVETGGCQGRISAWRLRRPGRLHLRSKHAAAKATYDANMLRVVNHNTLNLGFKLGEHLFSDPTQEQYRVAAGLGDTAPESVQGWPHLGEHVHDGSGLVASVNWTTDVAVTSAKERGQWGSRWAPCMVILPHLEVF